MNARKVKFEYDRTVDAAYLTLARGAVAESDEVEPGIVLDFDNERRIIGVEILNFGKRFSAQMPAGLAKTRKKPRVCATSRG